MPAMLIAAILLQAVPSQADAADGRCAAIMVGLQAHTDKRGKSDLESALMFFVGKIVGRSGSAAVAPALELGGEALVGAADEAARDAMADSCIAELNGVLPDQ